MTKLGKLWTGAVAYISLMVGAGLSMAGNLADTYRTRGQDVDTLDQILAIAWPALVILAIEMFVSPKWKRTFMFQTWRWVGCLAIGGMAMVASWTHLHDLLATRGQLAIVAILGPLAIDGMAIMATGLILSTRGHVATGQSLATWKELANGLAMATDQAGPAIDHMATEVDRLGHDLDTFLATYVDGHDVATHQDLADGQVATDALPEWAAQLNSFDADVDLAIRLTGQDVAKEAEEYLAKARGEALPKRVPVSQGVPAEAVELLRAWDGTNSGANVDIAMSWYFGKSIRTARRWRSMVLGPVSSPPASEG